MHLAKRPDPVIEIARNGAASIIGQSPSPVGICVLIRFFLVFAV
ncbi:MAG: hypothetical protein ACXWWN_05785 [Gemmatimonadales bacterium]